MAPLTKLVRPQLLVVADDLVSDDVVHLEAGVGSLPLDCHLVPPAVTEPLRPCGGHHQHLRPVARVEPELEPARHEAQLQEVAAVRLLRV